MREMTRNGERVAIKKLKIGSDEEKWLWDAGCRGIRFTAMFRPDLQALRVLARVDRLNFLCADFRPVSATEARAVLALLGEHASDEWSLISPDPTKGGAFGGICNRTPITEAEAGDWSHVIERVALDVLHCSAEMQP
jgi:hypothetical protein